MRDYDFVDAAVLALMAAAAFFFIAAGASACHHEFAGASTLDEAFAEVSDKMQARSVDGDESVRWECLADFHAAMAEKAAQGQQEAAQAAIDAEAYQDYQEAWYEPQTASYGYSGDGFMQQGVREHDGRTETWYSSNAAYHYRTGEWTVDEEGYYRTDEGYYVVAASDMPEGTVFEGSKGECMVLDCGCADGVTDYYVAW